MRLSLTPLIICCCAHISAQDSNAQFRYGSFSDTYNTLCYRIAIVNSEQPCEAVLITYLHGGSAVGNDNEANLNSFLETNILPYLEASARKAVIFVPQCPENRVWSETRQEHPVYGTLKSSIDEIAAEYGIVGNDCFILGGSAGGTGAWRMLSEYPEYFSCAVIAAGNPQGLDLEAIAKTPVYCVLSKSDRVIKFQSVYPLIKEIQQIAGADLTLEILENASHTETCINAYSDKALDKMFSYTSSGIEYVKPDSELKITNVYDIYGHFIGGLRKGLNIVRYSDGSVKKIIIP